MVIFSSLHPFYDNSILNLKIFFLSDNCRHSFYKGSSSASGLVTGEIRNRGCFCWSSFSMTDIHLYAGIETSTSADMLAVMIRQIETILTTLNNFLFKDFVLFTYAFFL